MPRDLSDRTKLSRGWGIIDISNPEEYIPWIHPRELFRGRGRRHLIPDLKYPKRMICLLSDLERDVYYMLRKDPLVQDLFEQYPLQLNITEMLCRQSGIKHPRDIERKENKYMTTDFIAIVKGLYGEEVRAYAVKPKSELNNKRTREKLLIEKRYWEQYNVPWSVITEEVVINDKSNKSNEPSR